MKRITPDWLTPPRRKRIYATCAAVSGVLVVYGVLDGEQALAWLAVPAAALGLAVDNT